MPNISRAKISSMKQQRLDGLADGIFAIVMTLLIIELRVPILGHEATDSMLWHELILLWPIFISLVLSFALLFTYWRAHHFIVSVYAKNLTVGLANLNALFFFLITLVPFSAHFLGEYPGSQISIGVYGSLVICIGLTLFFMRRHIELNPKIETAVITKADRRSGYIRLLFPVVSAALAISVSFWHTGLSTAIFTVAILFNLLPASSNIIHTWLDLLLSDDADAIEDAVMGIGRSVDEFGDAAKGNLKSEEYICVPKSAVFDHHRFSVFDQLKPKAAGKGALKKPKAAALKMRKLQKEAEKVARQAFDVELKKEVQKHASEGSNAESLKKGDIQKESKWYE